nr:putative reverse transcriptase domain-containing protein [Tanacetum cinerariifolium]
NGDNQREESRLNIISYTKAHEYLSKGCDVFLAHITTKEAKDKSEGKRLEDVPIVKDFPEVFPEDLLGIPPTRQVEFQIDLVPAGSKSRPPMLNKKNYVPWSSRLLRYAKSRPNGKLIHNSILNGPYVRKMIPELGDVNRNVNVTETFHLQTDDELSDKELKQIKDDDQAIQTILLGLPEDIYAAVDSCETTQEIWLRVQQMMKGSDIEIQEKKAKLFNEWERFTSNEGESIESYYHRFLKLMNDLKRNKHFPEKIASNLKFLNNLQPE